ncbi:MAG TPA: hypothetical protein VFW33_11970 [Gemmataceae bacterium]|nr:hypothetical protein [Gemmataceae bacterium]
MPRTFAAAVLLATLALLPPGKAVAGPPEGVSGKMVLRTDPIAEGLRRCHQVEDRGKRLELLEKLAATEDPRVAVALAELAWKRSGYFQPPGGDEFRRVAESMLRKHYLREPSFGFNEPSLGVNAEQGKRLWDEKGADLRRRAAQLPR